MALVTLEVAAAAPAGRGSPRREGAGGSAPLLSAALEIRARGRVLDDLDELGGPVPTLCRAAHCGTCRVQVLEGVGLLADASAGERETLARHGAAADERLLCIARWSGAGGPLRLRIVGPRIRRWLPSPPEGLP